MLGHDTTMVLADGPMNSRVTKQAKINLITDWFIFLQIFNFTSHDFLLLLL